MQSVRVVALLEPLDHLHAQRLVFDTCLDNEGKVAGRRMIFGILDNPDGRNEHYYPFTLDQHNELDFGLGFDDDRFGRLNLPRSTALAVGQTLTYTLDRELANYVITQIIEDHQSGGR
jgi:hypothetical protein